MIPYQYLYQSNLTQPNSNPPSSPRCLDRRKQRLFTPEPAASSGAKTDPTFGPSITTNQLNLEDHPGHFGLQATAEANLIISGWFFLIKICDLPRMLGATEEEAVMLSPDSRATSFGTKTHTFRP